MLNDFNQIASRVESKVSETRLSEAFIDKLAELLAILTSPETKRSMKMVAACALIYFLNPFDLLPDASGPWGFIDDLAAATTALVQLRSMGYFSDDTQRVRDQID